MLSLGCSSLPAKRLVRKAGFFAPVKWLAGKIRDRLRNDLCCVEWDVKL